MSAVPSTTMEWFIEEQNVALAELLMESKKELAEVKQKMAEVRAQAELVDAQVAQVWPHSWTHAHNIMEPGSHAHSFSDPGHHYSIGFWNAGDHLIGATSKDGVIHIEMELELPADDGPYNQIHIFQMADQNDQAAPPKPKPPKKIKTRERKWVPCAEHDVADIQEHTNFMLKQGVGGQWFYKERA